MSAIYSTDVSETLNASPHDFAPLRILLEKSQATPLSSLQKEGLLVFSYTHTLTHTPLLKLPCLNHFHMS